MELGGIAVSIAVGALGGYLLGRRRQRRITRALRGRCVEAFLEACEVVFRDDWDHTKCCLEDDSIECFVSNDGTFLDPGVDDESNNWCGRGWLLRTYRALREVVPEAKEE